MPETEPENLKPSRKGFFSKFLILFVTIATVLLLIESFYLYKYFTKNSANTQQASPQTSTSKSSAKLLTYKNTKAGFEFSYPERFGKPKLEPLGPTPIYANGEEENNTTILLGENSETGFLFGIKPKPEGVTIEQLFNASLALVPEEAKSSFTRVDVIVDGVNGVKVLALGRIVVAYFLTDKYLIDVYSPLPTVASEDEINTIFNSIKFVKK